jgi:ATP-dependent RNA helicase MRH4
MITTALLSRGLDFSADIKQEFIVDELWNMIDFLHRAERSGRPREKGKVVVFGQTTARGPTLAMEIRTKIRVLNA